MEFTKFTVVSRFNKKYKDIAWSYNQQWRPYILIVKRKNGNADIFCIYDFNEKWDKILERNNFWQDFLKNITKKYQIAFQLYSRFADLKKVRQEYAEEIAEQIYDYFVSLTWV